MELVLLLSDSSGHNGQPALWPLESMALHPSAIIQWRTGIPNTWGIRSQLHIAIRMYGWGLMETSKLMWPGSGSNGDSPQIQGVYAYVHRCLLFSGNVKKKNFLYIFELCVLRITNWFIIFFKLFLKLFLIMRPIYYISYLVKDVFP